MKTVLLFKRIDLASQILALLAPFIAILCNGNQHYFYLFHDSYPLFFICYFSVGAAQLISCAANAVLLDKFLRRPSRRNYEITVVATIILALLAFVIPSIITLVYLIALLFISPILAIWYCVITYRELHTVWSMVDRKQFV